MKLGRWALALLLLLGILVSSYILIVRYPMHANEFINAPLSFSIFEPAHFVMESGMMLGIKERAEKHP